VGFFFRRCRGSKTLIHIIKNFIKPGTVILSNCWKAYSSIKSERYRHLTVNRSIEFKNKETGTCTNLIESTWNAVFLFVYLFCLFVCFESHEQFFSYMATVTITGDGAANLDLCLALTAFSSEGSFTCHTYCDTGPPFFRSHPKDP
jgi:hypothetical protein